jgi:putative Mn2+ efflux pump MntP
VSKKRFSPMGLSIGLLLVILGFAIIYLGLIGEFTLVSELSGLYAEEVDAAGGVVFVVIGLIVMWVTRHEVE